MKFCANMLQKELEKQSQNYADESVNKSDEAADSLVQQQSTFDENHFDEQQVDERISNNEFPTEEFLNKPLSQEYASKRAVFRRKCF